MMAVAWQAEEPAKPKPEEPPRALAVGCSANCYTMNDAWRDQEKIDPQERQDMTTRTAEVGTFTRVTTEGTIVTVLSSAPLSLIGIGVAAVASAQLVQAWHGNATGNADRRHLHPRGEHLHALSRGAS